MAKKATEKEKPLPEYRQAVRDAAKVGGQLALGREIPEPLVNGAESILNRFLGFFVALFRRSK